MRKKLNIWGLIFIAFSLVLVGCGSSELSSSISENISDTEQNLKEYVSTDEALEIINNNKDNPFFTLIDVRTQGEYDEFYIEGSVLKTLDDYDSFIKSVSDIPLTNQILVYCRTQNRSKDAHDMLIDAGYKSVQYIMGGITAWAKEGKPLIEPYANSKKAVILKNDIKHEYLTNELLSFELDVANEKSLGELVSLYKKDVEYSIKNEKGEVVLNDMVTSDGSGHISLSINLSDFKIGTYQIQFKVIDKDYFSIPTFFQINVVDEIKEKDVNTYEKLKGKGMYDSLININSEYSEMFLKSNVTKNVSGFRLADFNLNKVSIVSQCNSLPTILVFGSPTCGACSDAWEYFSKLDTGDFNVMYVVTSINENEIDKTKQDVIDLINDRKLDFDTSKIYFDSVDFVWKNILHYKTTPQIVMFDTNNEIINFMTNDNNNFQNIDAFRDSLNNVLNKTYQKQMEYKNDLINITLNDGTDSTVYTIKKGSKLINIPNPVKDLYTFIGWSINDEIIDLNSFVFTRNETVVAKFEKVGILSSELKNYDYQLIDLRQKDEFDKNHLENSINIPSGELKDKFDLLNLDKNKTIVLYGTINCVEEIYFIRNKGYQCYYLSDFDLSNIDVKLTYEQRKNNNELDPYFEYRVERDNLKEHYGDNYYDLTFKDFDKNIVHLKDKLQKEAKPTIIMIGSTTCGACIAPWNDFIKQSETFEFNFIESVAFSGNDDEVIDAEFSKLSQDEIKSHKTYKIFDINRYYGANNHPLLAKETPIFYVLDKQGNLTNLMSSFSKAVECAAKLKNSISIKTSDAEGFEKRFDTRKGNDEFVQLESENNLYKMIESNYAKFLLNLDFFDYSHRVKNINAFVNENDFKSNKPLVLYIMNSKNNDFEQSIMALDNYMSSIDDRYNFLSIVDNNSYKQTDLIMKPYSGKIMFDDYNTNVSNNLLLNNKSYFVILDEFGNLTNACINFNDIGKIVDYTKNSKSVLSPNSLTKQSVVKPGDITINKNEAFEQGYISHLDSTKDMARYEYLNINFGRNYNDLEIIDSQDKNVKLSSIVDNTRPTIVCFIQDYMDDFYYCFTPLLKLKDKANIVIVFTNRRDTPYNQNYVDRMIKLAEEKSIAKAKEPQNIDYFKNIVLEQNPELTGDALDKALDEFLQKSYDYDPIKPYIYGSYAYLTTPLLNTEVRGIQLYLDRNGNLANISQTYYSVGNIFSSVLNKIGDRIAVEK